MSLPAYRPLGLLRIPIRAFSRTAWRAQQQNEDAPSSQSRQETDEQIKYDITTGRPAIPKSSQRSIGGSKLLIKPSLSLEGLRNYELERLRIVPTLKTFFGGNPVHEDNLNNLNSLIRKYINLPTKVMDQKELQNTKFLSYEEYKERCQSGTRLKNKHHKELTSLLHRLRSIDRELIPRDVSEVLKEFSSSKNELSRASEEKLKTLDSFGRAATVGKRKRSKATVYLVKGEGQVIVNGKSLTTAFPKDTDRKKVAHPFQVVGQEGAFNVFAEVRGGGITGQIEAIMYGISKGLIIHNPLFKSRLHKAGLMTRDIRKVERKKPGKVKARKSPTWVKR